MDWAPHIRPTRAEVDLDAVVHNARTLAGQAHSPLLAVVKADGYGHGAVAVAQALQAALGAQPSILRGFALSLVEEGLELRNGGIRLPILVMGPSLMSSHETLVLNDLMPMVSDARHLVKLSEAAQQCEHVLGIHLKVDTGMGRLGVHEEDLASALDSVSELEGLALRGIASHLACADTDDANDATSMSRRQLRRFRKLVDEWRPRLGSEVSFHIANSAGVLSFVQARFDLARPGLALYGNGASESVGLIQALRMISEVSQIRVVRAGESVSYGARWTAQQDTRVAIVPLGYADGLPRSVNAAGKACVLIGGHRCSVLGTVSMDMIVVDISSGTDVQLGDEVVVLGRQGQSLISVAEVAELCGISEYEVSCGISKRVPRRYVGQYVD